MGSSYRSDLNGGRIRSWELKLRSAVNLIREVTDELSDSIGSDGQFDNAAEDGVLRDILCDVMNTIKDELPMTPEEKNRKIAFLKWQLERLETA